MRINIEDLEALKELNDELEENHVETEKAMQEDLGEEDFSMNPPWRTQSVPLECRPERCPNSRPTTENRIVGGSMSGSGWYHWTIQGACYESSEVSSFEVTIILLQLTLVHSSDLDALRAQTQTAQNESATAASQTAAMMSLNLKLQSSASKNQAKLIELEIKKLEARETRELLSIVQVGHIHC
jgi:dynactin 1